MFRENKHQQQPGFFNSDFLMPRKMHEQLYASWDHIFRVIRVNLRPIYEGAASAI
ncbi:MAG: hypothetical protein R6X34_20635 [Chloroflexota bacterium]